MSKFLSLSPNLLAQNVIIFGDKGFKEATKEKEVMWVIPNSIMTGVLIGRGH